MPAGRTNKFARARQHLRSTHLDEKIQMLNEIPTNNTTTFFVTEPDVFETIPAVTAPLDLEADDAALLGKDTSGLFDGLGNSLAAAPPGDTSYILGPMVSVYFPDGDYSAIGYIQQDTRKVVNLARIPGTVSGWGIGGNVEGFTSYSQLTLEQALWYRDQLINGNTSDYRVFYIGVFEQINSENPNRDVTDPSAGVDKDEFDRWIGQIISAARVLVPEISNVIKGKFGPDPDIPPGIANPFTNPSQALKDVIDLIGYGNSQARSALLGIPSNILNDILSTSINKEGIAAGINMAGKITGLESATNMLNDYNEFLANPNGPGSSPDNRLDASSSLSPTDYTNLSNAVNTPEINNLISGLQNGEFSDEVVSVPGLGEFTEADIKKDTLKNTIERAVNDQIYKSAGLDNSLHNNVQVDIEKTLETGQITLTKEYVFRPGGSVAQAEGNPIGKVLSAMGVPLDTAGSGNPLMTYAGFAAAAVGLSNAESHGGVYNAPGMFYQITLPIGGNMGESKYSLKTTIKEGRYKNLKKPYVLPEIKQEKIKYRPKVNKTEIKSVGDGLMKKAEVPTSFKRLEDNMWKKQDRDLNARYSQERKNMILDAVGTSDHAWEYITDRSASDNDAKMYEHFGQGVKNKIIEKKKIGNDYIIKMYNEEGKLETLTQSVLNERLQKKYELKEQETLDAYNDPLVKRIKNKLRTQIDYDDKPAIKGYPDEKPKQMNQGWHPDYGDRHDYYNRLDRHSADTMQNAPTQNLKIDKKVESQTTGKKLKRVKDLKKNK